MSTWNYRIVRKKVEDNPEVFRYGIHEAYYDKNGKISAITEEPEDVVSFTGDIEPDGLKTHEEVLKEILRLMLLACDKPMLDWDKIPEEGAKGLGEE